ncbi:MAG: hypothetical protein ACXWLQ_10515 [Rhizomicrobium sp.]
MTVMLKEFMDAVIRTLRARRLDRIAVGYAVAAWLVVQAASIALPTFDAPVWALRAIIIFVLMGFPITIVAAWFAAPHLFGDEHHASRLSRAHAVLALFGAIIIVVAADLAYLLSRATTTLPEQSVVHAAVPTRSSIAVLPFVNMSGDPAKEYFSDGISEELLNDLANIPSLLVAARTSSFAFKGRNENIRDIARILAVRTILEGSVRENGRHIRITAQLINAQDGYHLWSATYDRDLTDVLAVQDEIAEAITAALTHQLVPTPSAPKPQKSQPIDQQAYKDYLLGKHELAPRTEDGAEAALALFQKVTTLAPAFADGFAALARAKINLAEYHPERGDLIPAADDDLRSALALDPKNVSALSSHLDLALHKLDWQSAIADARLMRAVNPNSATVLHEMFRFYQFLGFPDLAFAAASGAAKLDPLSFVDRLNVAAALLHDGRFAEASTAARAALALETDPTLVLSILCTASAYEKDLDTARSIATRLTREHFDRDAQLCLFQIAVGEKRLDAAKQILDRLALTYLQGGPSASELGEGYAIVGENNIAIQWLERAYESKEYLLVLLPNEKIVPPTFFDNAGWKAFYRRPLFVAWRAAHDRVAAEVAARN